ncbi:MAG: hypothetical protein Tsb0013_20240 [Phycisphaerales bacterium]
MKPRGELSGREVDDLITSLAQRLGDTTVPSLPQVAIKIIDLVGNPNSTIKQFAEVISGDQALTGRLLRMANSAAFAQRKSVTSVERAMVLLGLERLKALALGFHLSKAAATDDSAIGFRSMWTQSLYRGCVAMKIAEKINKSCSGEAFVIGFMSDAGVPSMPALVGDDYPGDEAVVSHPTKLHAQERATYQCTHVDVILALCKIWKLPERLTKPIGNHHTRPSACNVRDDMSLLNSIGYFVGNLPLTPDGQIEQVTTTSRDAQRLFEFDTANLQAILSEAGTDFEAFRTLFGDLIDPSMTIDQILEDANAQIVDTDTVPEDGEATTMQAGGMTLRIAQHGAGHVSVAVSQNGEDLISEQLTPDATDETIRTALLLDEATPEELASVRALIVKLAA